MATETEDGAQGVTLTAYVPAALAARVEAWQATLPARTSRSAAVTALLEAGLDAVAVKGKRARQGKR